jgi:hypothetical protein
MTFSRALPPLLLLAASLARAAGYDPDAGRAALRADANAAYADVVDAAGLSLEAEKIASIKSGLDEGARRAGLAADDARSLDSLTLARLSEMQSYSGGSSGSDSPDKLFAAQSDAAADARKRWSTLLQQRDAAAAKGNGTPSDKDRLRKISDALDSADGHLRNAEDALKSADGERSRLRTAVREVGAHFEEMGKADAEVMRLAPELTRAVGEAKSAVDAIGQEPRNVTQEAAVRKLGVAKGVAQAISVNADAACNRTAEIHSRSKTFDRARPAGDAFLATVRSELDAAKPFLDTAQSLLGSGG